MKTSAQMKQPNPADGSPLQPQGQAAPAAPVPPAPPAPASPAPAQAVPEAPPAPPAPGEVPPPVDPADGLEEFLEDATNKPGATAEGMGVKPDVGTNLGPAKYVSVYGHLRARQSTAGITVFDPHTKRALVEVPLKASVRSDHQAIRKAAIGVLTHIMSHGLSRTAERCRGKYHTADSVVDYAVRAQDPAPEADKKDSQADGESNLADKPGAPKDNSQDGTTTDRQDNPAGRETPGLGGKSASLDEISDPARLNQMLAEKQAEAATATKAGDKARAASLYDECARIATRTAKLHTASPSPSGGVQDGGVSSAADQPKPKSSKSLDSTNNADDTMKDDRKGPEPDVLSEAVTNMLNMEHAAMRTAQNQPMPTPPPAPGDDAPMPADLDKAASLEEIAENYRIFFANRARKDAADATRRFASKFLRAFRVAVQRTALNLEDNSLKAAAYDVLTTERRISASEDFVPLDDRTAQFCIEEALGVQAMLEHVDGLVRTATKIMAYPSEIIAQMEEDLGKQSPMMPQAQPMGEDALDEVIGQEMLPADPMTPQAQEDVDPNMDPLQMAPQGQMGAPPPAGEMPPMQGQADPMAPPANDPLQMAANRTRQAALNGSQPPPGAPAPRAGRVQASDIRSALGVTRSASLATHYNRLPVRLG